MKTNKTKFLPALICAIMMLFSVSRVSAHAVQAAWCVLGNGFVRVYIEHWHGAQDASSIAGNSMSITTTYGSTTVNQNLDPTGFVNSTVIGSLPAGAGLTVLGGCQDANTYNNWVYYDFAPAACNTSVTITFNGGNTFLLDDGCNVWPKSITNTFTDISAPTFTSCGDVTVQSCTATAVTFAKTAVDDCDPSPSITYSIASGSTFNVGTTQVTATATDNLNKTSTCVFNVVVSPPAISATATNNSPCVGTTLNLGITTVGSSTYSWAGPNSFTSTSQNPSISNAQAVNAGTYTVTITDGACVNTRTTNVTVQSLAAITASSSSPYNGGVNTNLYIGYGSQNATLTAAGIGGTISWSPTTNLSNPSILNPVFTPSGSGNYSYTVTGSTSNCNSYTANITMCVSDIHVPGTTGTKYAVYMCHKEPVTNKTWTQAVVVRGVSEHFVYHPGDYLGQCGSNPCASKKRDFDYENVVIDEQYLEVMCTPNPFRQSFKLHYISNSPEQATISIYGMTGNLVEKITLEGVADEAELGTNLPNGIYSVSFNQGDKNRMFRMIKID